MLNTLTLIASLLAYSPDADAWLPTPPPADALDARDCAADDASCDDLRPWLAYDPHGSAEPYAGE
jgi:hypothetical protein